MGEEEYENGEEYVEEMLPPIGPQVSWVDSIQAQFGNAPWWIISTAVHVIALMLMTLVTVGMPPKPEDDVLITAEFKKDKEEELKKQEERELPEDDAAEEVVEPVIFEEVEIDDEFEDEEMDDTAQGCEDAISDIPLGGTGVISTLGVGGGAGGMFGLRSGRGRPRALKRHGGTSGSEEAVDRALRWLARHQDPDGKWDAEKWEGEDCDGGVSGLATLAFLGAGHTEKAGKWKNVVRKAVDWLISQQEDNGATAIHYGGGGYNHAIAGLALAEAYGMARKTRTGQAAQKAIDYSIKEHQAPHSGWRYSAKSPGDLSVTGWFVMQLKSAKVSGLQVDPAGFQGALNFLEEVTEKPQTGDWSEGGRCCYTPGKGYGSVRLASIGLLCRQFMGFKKGEWQVMGSANFVDTRMPTWERYDYYYWYYGTLTQFQMGGSYWKRWNPAMRDMLIANQRRGGDEDGSWDPGGGDHCNSRGGRAYSTALGALCLEVYYRYLPMYK